MSLAKIVGGKFVNHRGRRELRYVYVKRGFVELEHGNILEHIVKYHLSLPNDITGRKIYVLDIENCGLPYTSPINTITIGALNGEIMFHTLFAQDFQAERAILAKTMDMLREADILFTYNGTAFDIERLTRRIRTHQLFKKREKPDLKDLLGDKHIDLYPLASKLLKEGTILPDRKLTTLEKYLFKTHREGDVRGEEIPRIYHAFVKGGKNQREQTEIEEDMARVIDHNILDVASTCSVIQFLQERQIPVWAPLKKPKIHIYQ